MSLLRALFGLETFRKAWDSFWLENRRIVCGATSGFWCAGLVYVATYYSEWIWIPLLASGPLLWLLLKER